MPESPSVMVQPARRWRWRWRVSLRSLMVIILILGCWLGSVMNQARVQTQAVALLEAHGGRVAYDWEYVGATKTPDRSPLAPRWLRRLLSDDLFQTVVEVDLGAEESRITTEQVVTILRNLPDLKIMNFNAVRATDQELKALDQSFDLEVLLILNNGVTDEGIGHLAHLKKLVFVKAIAGDLGDESLRVLGALPAIEKISVQGGNRFTDTGLAFLAQTITLKSLLLGYNATPLTDAGIKHLRGLTRMERLGLMGNEVTDAGLQELRQMTQLNELRIKDNPVTAEGIKRLQAHLPKLTTILQ